MYYQQILTTEILKDSWKYFGKKENDSKRKFWNARRNGRNIKKVNNTYNSNNGIQFREFNKFEQNF